MKHKKYLCGIAEYYRNGHYDQWLKILGIKVFGKSLKAGSPRINFLGLRIRISASARVKRAVKDAQRALNRSYSEIYILFNNSGETSLMLASIREQLHGRDDILFIGTKGYHMQLLDHFLPDTAQLFIPELWSIHLEENIPQKFQVEKSLVHIIGPLSYFLEYERVIRESQNLSEIPHFFSRYSSYQVPFENLNAKYPDIPQWAAELADKKIESLNIKKPFVLICNETLSNMNFPDTFYQELTKACRSLGYDVLFNSMTLTEANMYGHTTHSSIAEAMYFAHRARCVIGIRSGLLDILLPYCQSMISVYTPFKERWRFPTVEANRVHAAFTLKKLPVIKPSQLHEIIVDGSMMEREGDNIQVLKNIDRILTQLT